MVHIKYRDPKPVDSIYSDCWVKPDDWGLIKQFQLLFATRGNDPMVLAFVYDTLYKEIGCVRVNGKFISWKDDYTNSEKVDFLLNNKDDITNWENLRRWSGSYIFFNAVTEFLGYKENDPNSEQIRMVCHIGDNYVIEDYE